MQQGYCKYSFNDFHMGAIFIKKQAIIRLRDRYVMQYNENN